MANVEFNSPRFTVPNTDGEVQNSIKGIAVFRRLEIADAYKNKPNYGFDWYVGENFETKYKEPFNYNDDKILLNGRSKIKKEYQPFFKYTNINKFNYTNSGINFGNSGLNINFKQYLTPWFSGFAKDELGNFMTYEIILYFKIDDAKEGKINISSEDESIDVVFSDTGDSSFDFSEGLLDSDGLMDKKIKITFKDYITQHTCLIVHFHSKPVELEEKEERKPGELETVIVVAGQLMGVLNVYKNNIEYDINFRYINVFFKGLIEVEGFEEKIYLSKRNPAGLPPDYQENEKLIKKRDKLNSKITNLNIDLIKVKTGGEGWFDSSEKSIKEKIIKNETELKALEDICKKRANISEDIYKEQTLNIKKYETNIKSWKPFFKDAFSQSIVRYKEVKSTNYEELEIDVDLMDSFFDDLKLTKNFYLVDDDDEEANSNRIKNKIIKSFEPSETKDKKEFITFLLPFGIKADVKKGLILLGSAESVSYEADSAVLTPQTDKSTFIHECGHTFNLPHTFYSRGGNWLGGGGIKIAQGTSDNIMDYEFNPENLKTDTTSHVPIITEKIALWKFQWDIIQKDPNLLQNIKKINL